MMNELLHVNKEQKRAAKSNLLVNKFQRLKESFRTQRLPGAGAFRKGLILLWSRRSRKHLYRGGAVEGLRSIVLLVVLEQQNSLYSLLLKDQIIFKGLFLVGRTL